MLGMQLNAFRIRLALMAAGLVVALIYLAATGQIGGKPHGTIAIEWGAYLDEFAGLSVEVDGRYAGKLTYLGARATTGFEVAEGSHSVRVVGSKWNSVPRTVDVRRDHTSRFLLDAQETMGADGQSKPAVVLQ
jgi:hypothetical protein